MKQQFNEDDLNVMRALRKAFVPAGHCCPHKIFPGSKRRAGSPRNRKQTP